MTSDKTRCTGRGIFTEICPRGAIEIKKAYNLYACIEQNSRKANVATEIAKELRAKSSTKAQEPIGTRFAWRRINRND